MTVRKELYSKIVLRDADLLMLKSPISMATSTTTRSRHPRRRCDEPTLPHAAPPILLSLAPARLPHRHASSSSSSSSASSSPAKGTACASRSAHANTSAGAGTATSWSCTAASPCGKGGPSCRRRRRSGTWTRSSSARGATPSKWGLLSEPPL